MTNERRPRVHRMVMFKHGVAYLERRGPADGPFELSFDKDEMNDVLKSLAAWVERGQARITSIAFEKPEDPEAVLARRKLVLEPTHALLGLFAAFRGRRVRVELAGDAVEGEVIGFEDVPTAEGASDRRVLLRVASDRVGLFPLREVRGVSLLEAPSRADLELLVDRTRAATAGDNRIVEIGLEGTAEDLRVAYVVPAPVWRVTYRIARGKDEAGADTTNLIAWGIVHNPADEDLEDVELTLTTGQPVSFVIDLYHPKNVRRVQVEESSRAMSAAPTAYGNAMPMMQAAPASVGSFGAPAGGAPPPAPPPARHAMAAAMTTTFGIDAGASAGADRGELFEYRVASRVSIKRGGSAMVPLLAASVDAKKERIWRQGSAAAPDLVLTFPNATGAVLEEGAAVVYDDDVYAGEAMVPYRVRGAVVSLAFAKDLAVRCKRESAQTRVVSRISLGKHGLLEEVRWEERIELEAESDHADAIDVVFELPKLLGRAYAEGTPQPFESTSAHHRFRVAVAPRSRAELKLREQWLEHRRIEYETVQQGNLDHWLRERLLDAGSCAALAPIVALWARAAEIDQRIAAIERARASAYEGQKQLTAQLGVLKDGGPEGELRLRYARELAGAQDQVNRMGQEIQSLANERERAREEAARLRAALVLAVP
jgi:hypothetical protein